jgi:hypothetical protein
MGLPIDENRNLAYELRAPGVSVGNVILLIRRIGEVE